MSIKVQFRRGNTTQTAAFTGAVAEVTVNTDNNTLVVHDGTTSGGWQTPTLAYTQAAFNTANAAGTSAYVQSAFDKANSAASNTVITQGVDATQNTWIAANQVYSQAAFGFANSVNTYAYSAYSTANSAQSNTINIQAVDTAQNTWIAANQVYSQAAYAQANVANTKAQSGYDFSNTVNTYAYSAYSTANSAVSNTIITQGVDSTQNTWIAANQVYSQAAFAFANSVNTYAYSAYAQANSEPIGTAAFIKANGVVQTGFTTISANGTSITPSTNTDTLTITAAVTNGINVLNPSSKTIDFGLRNSGVTAGTYGNTSSIPTVTVDSFGRVTSISNNSITVPPGTSVYGNTGQITANTSTGVVAIGLATTGVTAGTYGNTTNIPVITVDTYGRITSVSNTVITSSGGGGGSANGLSLTDGTQISDANTVFSTNTVNQTTDTFSATAYRSAQYLIQAISGDDVHLTNVLLTHNDVNIYLTEYGSTYSATLISINATLVSGNVRLTISPTIANTTIDFVRTAIIARTLPGGPSADLELYVTGNTDIDASSGSYDLSI